MQTQIIIAKQVSLQISGKVILKPADFSIAKNECVAIVGANGAGKTSLLQILSGLKKPSSGDLSLAETDISKIGIAPDTPPVYRHDTVMSYLKFIAGLRGIPNSVIKTKIEKCLQTFELESVSSSYIYTLSKGMQQRLNLAQAVINNPSLLILDEPTNALDYRQCENLRNFLKILQSQQTTIIIATHQYNEIIPICDYMLRIHNGELQKILPPLQNKDIKETNDQLYHST